MKSDSPVMELTTVSAAGFPREKFTQTVIFRDGSETENRVINLYPEVAYQKFEGFGGAVTDSAGYVYSLMTEEQRSALMETYFSPEKMRYTLVRVPLDSCDFSLRQHEAVSDPEDFELRTFSFSGMEEYILPMLEDARESSGGNLRLMLTPWSPPAFMKTNGKREMGGKLKDEYREMWAEYLCRYIEEFRKRGFTVERISLQNESKAVQTWDSCIFTAEKQKAFLADFMWPALKRHSLTDVEVFIWDHNKERVYEWMRDIIDERTDPMVAGAACHWYSGDHFEALDLCSSLYPDKKLIISESCVEILKYGSDDGAGAARMLAREIIGDLNHGAHAFYDWNLLLDENGGPNYVKNYTLAPFLYDTVSGELIPQLIAGYYGLFSHYLIPGSVRIAKTCFSDVIDATAWRRPDGSIAVFMLNKSDKAEKAVLRLEDGEAEILLEKDSLSAGIIKKCCEPQ